MMMYMRFQINKCGLHKFVVDLNSLDKKDLYKLFLLNYKYDDSYYRLVWCDLLLFVVYVENCYSYMLRQKNVICCGGFYKV